MSPAQAGAYRVYRFSKHMRWTTAYVAAVAFFTDAAHGGGAPSVMMLVKMTARVIVRDLRVDASIANGRII